MRNFIYLIGSTDDFDSIEDTTCWSGTPPLAISSGSCAGFSTALAMSVRENRSMTLGDLA